MSDQDQITRHEREIGELRGKLDSLATKEYVREVVDEQTRELKKEFNAKIDDKFDNVISRLDTLSGRFDELSGRLDTLSGDVKNLNEKQHRITGAADIIKTALPLLISVATLIVLIISLLSNAGG
ncbi:MAG: hypothetical protein F4X02_14175 [Chloroflexi bacterium]|nr:hypothetical protein [Chloroflexota bacterium]